MPRPRKDFDMAKVQELLNDGFDVSSISKSTGIPSATLRRRLKERGLLRCQRNSSVSNLELLNAVLKVKEQFPNFGLRQLQGALVAKDIKVYRERLLKMLRLVDPEGVHKRSKKSVKGSRVKYRSYHTHYTWHADSNLKLGKYKIVIRGAVDGLSRLCLYLDCGPNNTGAATLLAFKAAVTKYGFPIKLRLDKGSENRQVASYMIQARGIDMKSVITGSSVHNTRIERYWRDVRTGVLSKYEIIFKSLEEADALDVTDPLCIACLHHVYMPLLQKDLCDYRKCSNAHKIRTAAHLAPNTIASMFPMPEENQLTMADVTTDQDEELQERIVRIFDDDSSGAEFSHVEVTSGITKMLTEVVQQLSTADDVNLTIMSPEDRYKLLVECLRVCQNSLV